MERKENNKSGIWGFFSAFDTGLSLADKLSGLFFFVFVTASSTATAFLAKLDPVLKMLGPVYWVAVGLGTAVLLSLMLCLLRSASYRKSKARYYDRLSVPRGLINPLEDSFKDVIVFVEDLRLPSLQVHDGKKFKRCKIVGPGTLYISGGFYRGVNFNSAGDILAVPDGTRLTGVVALENCNVEECEFNSVTILTDQGTGRDFSEAGFSVKGLNKRQG